MERQVVDREPEKRIDPLVKYAEWNSLDVNENANRYIGPTGFFSYLLEDYMKRELLGLMPNRVLRSHSEGLIYIHKLPHSIYIPYCSGHSMSRLLERGLETFTVVSRPAKHFDTFVDHVANYLITMQHYFTGAQAFSSVEWYAGPFIRNDGLDSREVKQHIQRLLFNLNYPTRVGMQTPFTNFTVTMDAARKALEGDSAVYDGKKLDPLGAYEDEAKTFLKAMVELLMEGDALGQPFTFPIPTLMTTASWLWEDPELHELIFRTAAKRGSFYWLNTRVVDPDASFAMCCRIAIDRSELTYALSGKGKPGLGSLKMRDLEEVQNEYWKKMERQSFGGIWAMPDITGSVNVADVNLPRVALDAQSEESKFWELYEERLMLVREAVDWFRQRYVKLMKQYPSLYGMILKYMPEFPSSHFNTIGLVGLPEAAAIFMADPKLWFEGSRSNKMSAADLMRKMVEFAAKHAREWMRESGVPWNVEEVPAESASPKMASMDLKLYPDLSEYLPDPSEPVYSTSIAPYYGSIELPERIEIEARVQKFFTGGVMMHIFLGEEAEPESLAKLAKRMMETDLVYWSFTPSLTYCPSCRRTFTGLHTKCPVCGNENVEIWSRIIGYYRPLKNWNPQRRKEFWTRKHYSW
ncbi:MAG: anaerobic ribonucleoside triphosphate reductase [Fervidicoccaceae archaeon]